MSPQYRPRNTALISTNLDRYHEPLWGAAIHEPQGLHLDGRPWIATPPIAAARDEGHNESASSRVGLRQEDIAALDRTTNAPCQNPFLRASPPRL